MAKKPSIIGGACIIASICVGAGMLGLPSVGAGAWTGWSILVISLTMVMMTLSGWMLLEAFKGYDLTVSFATVTRNLLDKRIHILNNIAVYFVGGILIYAYITSSGLILKGLFGVDSQVASVLFVLVFSSFVWHSTWAVDRISVILIVFMLLSFVFSLSGLILQIHVDQLFDSFSQEIQRGPYALTLLPVALTSFGYHHSVASMRAYYGNEDRAKYAILGGTLIALSFYILWLVSVFGHLPRDRFAPILAQGGEVEILLEALDSVISSDEIVRGLQAFSMAAILSSFIGVGLGVFDYLSDFFAFDQRTTIGRTQGWAMTFLPPLVMSLLFPFGFIIAIGYAGAVATIWTCIIPALLVTEARKRNKENVGFVAPGGRGLVVMVALFGVIVAFLHVLHMLKMLPVFK